MAEKRAIPMPSWLPMILTAYFALSAVLLVLLKIRQLEREAQLTNSEQAFAPYVSATAKGLVRRLDDPSFWFVLATMMSAFFVARAVFGLRLIGGSLRRIKHGRAWLMSSGVIATGYLAIVALKKETLFFGCNSHADGVITAIQALEGGLILSVIVLGPMLLSVGLSVLDETLVSKAIPCQPLSQIVACLCHAGWSPIALVLSGVTLCQGLNLLGSVFDRYHALGVAALAMQTVPFLYLRAKTKAVHHESLRFGHSGLLPPLVAVIATLCLLHAAPPLLPSSKPWDIALGVALLITSFLLLLQCDRVACDGVPDQRLELLDRMLLRLIR